MGEGERAKDMTEHESTCLCVQDKANALQLQNEALREVVANLCERVRVLQCEANIERPKGKGEGAAMTDPLLITPALQELADYESETRWLLFLLWPRGERSQSVPLSSVEGIETTCEPWEIETNHGVYLALGGPYTIEVCTSQLATQSERLQELSKANPGYSLDVGETAKMVADKYPQKRIVGF